MSRSLGVLETIGLTPAMVALDAMEKAATIRVLQSEWNDFCGVVVKIEGDVDAVETAVDVGRRMAERMGGRPVATVLARPDSSALHGIRSEREYNPLIEQEVVFFPEYEVLATRDNQERSNDMSGGSIALGFIETQGFTAVFEAIDTACKAANVEVLGKEKLGGGYVTIVIQGDLAAVTAAIEAGRRKVEGLGTLIAAHVLARPSPSVLALLPKRAS
ncbi:MAG: BMC domain-containing protein [Pirellulales bacterium]|nr:BMC domain-containing protein [Pirellulales bacterium]